MKYSYQAQAPHGDKEAGEIDAASVQDALRQLQKRGLAVYAILPAKASKKVQKPVNHAHLLYFFEELATLLQSGVTLVDALESQLEGREQDAIAEAISALVDGIQKGGVFSQELAKLHRLNIPDYMIQLAAAGEMTGKLASSLAKGVEQMRFEEQVAKEMRHALLYPLILVATGVIAIGLVFSLVVPKFTNLLNGNVDLPWLAQAVLKVGVFFNDHWFALLVTIILVTMMCIFQLRKATVRQGLLNSLARLPIIGAWLIEAETGRWTSVMSALLGSGVPIVQSLELANKGVAIRYRLKRLEQAVVAVKGGEPLSKALQNQEALTPIAYNMLRVGERSGEVALMLSSLARLYEKSSRDRMKRVLVLIEPLAILLIGGVIGTIIIGIVLAITSASDIPI